MNIHDGQFNQREYMRKLVGRFGKDRERVVEEFMAGEERGDFDSMRDQDKVSPKKFASRMWREGIEKGWLFREGRAMQTWGTNTRDPSSRCSAQ